MSASAPDGIDDLLAWHVNGTLSPDEHARIESGLQSNPRFAADAAFMREVAHVVSLGHTGFDAEGTLRALNNLAAPRRAQSATARNDALFVRVQAWVNSIFQPRFAAAIAIAVIAAQAVVIGGLMSRADAPRYSDIRSQTDSSESRDVGKPVYRLTFKPDTKEHEIRALMVSSGATIVSGPTQMGDYYVSFARPDNQARIQRLESSPVIDSLQKLNGLPPDIVR